MRLLHTSDWHLGQNFMGKSRAPEHQAFLDWLLQQIGQHQVDALILAGDVFDTGTPPSYARELYNNFIVRLQSTGCQLVVLGGNHDSVVMLHESRELLACLDVCVIGGPHPDPAADLRLLNRRDGSPGALLCAVPYLRPRDLVSSRAGESAQEKQAALGQAIADHYGQLYRLAQDKRRQLGLALPIIASGHLTTVGASSSESVREIYIGTLEAFPADAFPPLDYLALGHLHKAQRVAGREHFRYSGSPIPLSFDELGNEQQVLLVEFQDAQLARIEPLPVPRTQMMARWRGNLQQLAEQFAALAADGPTLWLDIEVAGDDYLNDLHNRILALCEGKRVEVLRLRRQRANQRQALLQGERETLSELTVGDVFERRLQREPEADEQRLAGLRQAFSEIQQKLSSGERG